jgi:hypothetical protein
VAKPRGVSAKVVLRREKLSEATRIVADGLFEAGKRVILEAAKVAPDSPYDPYPTGEGLPKQGGVLAYVGNDKVNGWSIRGVQPRKPRSARILTKQHSVTVLVGFGFPARLAETGTVDTPAHPWFSPTAARLRGQIPGWVGEVTRPKISRAK